MDAQRALLDELMGRNRDGDKPNDEIKDYRDRRVCKYFLCGLCPHELFQNTKMDLGECPKLHIPNLRTKYEKDPKKSSGYEYELERELLRFISDLDKKIYRAQKRLEEQEGSKAPSLMDVENCKEVLEITAEIQEVMLKAEEAGNEGQVDLSMELMEKVEDLKQKKADAQANAMLQSVQGVGARPPDYRKGGLEMKAPGLSELLPRNPLASTDVNQKLRVCDVCGAFLSIFDSDRRLANHFGGKLHLGYLQIRKKVEEIAELRQEQRRKSSIPPPTEAVEKKEDTAMESPTQEVKEALKAKPEDRNSRSISRRCVHLTSVLDDHMIMDEVGLEIQIEVNEIETNAIETGIGNETKIVEIRNETEIEIDTEIVIKVGAVIDDREVTMGVATKVGVEVHLATANYIFTEQRHQTLLDNG
uniref:Uncharacterized protein AlNc14C170G7990 n=1 Tax=Albugo laibachii Nc14 TaxID=890382 RepID=F0WNG5_9STRA|nr:unknown protein putative [Albugo laibachii Nc14]|eukprot:CCA22856.1 unknown protein putative [Albugo laibachii Nc14]